jgi:arylsulfatase A-like enzyme
MTSLYPSQHGAIGAETRLPEEAGTLAEALRAVGYHTVGVVSHDFVGSMHGLAQGFDVFDETNVVGHEETTSKALTLTALATVADVSEPFFLWVHYFDPHFTYVRHPEVGFADGYEGELPPEITSGRLTGELAALRRQGKRMEETDLAYIEAVYDEEIAHTDLWVGTLWKGLGTRGLADRSVLIFTSDHGEYFLERGRFFHGKDVYEPLIHVPLIIGGAIDDDLRGVTIEHSVEVRSIPATVMGLLGVEPHGFAGADLLSAEHGGGIQTVYSEGSHAFGEDERKYAAVHEGWKLIRNLDDDRFELYELATDRNERRDRWQVESEIKDGIAPILVQRLLDFAGLPRLQARQLDISPEQRRRLESLGYVR